jgi:hypothetical protein
MLVFVHIGNNVHHSTNRRDYWDPLKAMETLPDSWLTKCRAERILG